LDVGLPSLNGLEVLQKARDLKLAIAPVIIVTGFPQQAHKRRAESLGAVAYLTKAPLSLDKLVDAITNALDSKG
jgi:DNA-binding response OmpR family regulator